jgi:hypothetical protein
VKENVRNGTKSRRPKRKTRVKGLERSSDDIERNLKKKKKKINKKKDLP